MAAGHYEVEIKCLLGEEERANSFKRKLLTCSDKVLYTDFSNQLNHYFEGGDAKKLHKQLEKKLSAKASKELKKIAEKGTNISVRTRKADDTVLFVVKASLGSDSSENGVIRSELEVPVKLSLDALDNEICKAGYRYQAKWSRKREEYRVGDINVCFDKNAGYGYLVEFEKVLRKPDQVQQATEEIRNFMKILKVPELKQSKLERMFKYYNNNWQDYYGTEKVFDYSKI